MGMKKTMLIVDDSEMNREILNLMFMKNFEVIEAETGKEAIEVLQACKGKIDIVLLDLMMPDLDGLSLLKDYKNEDYFRFVPVVVITASDTVDDQIKAFRYGANDYVSKPFVPEIVISRVNNVIDISRRFMDLSEETQKLRQKAEKDLMTGLYNKGTTEELIKEHLERYPDRIHSMMIVDIDNFKSVNDMEGHQVGDQTIEIIAGEIVKNFRKSDIVGRVGGDEFMVFMSNVPSKKIALDKANELVLKMKYKQQMKLPVYVTVSIGVSFAEKEKKTFEELFSQADNALYAAKNAGKARVCEFGKEVKSMEDDDRAAILLLSHNRNLCSTVQAVYSMDFVIAEVNSRNELKTMSQKLKDKVIMAFVDATLEEDTDKLWKELLGAEPWLMEVPVISVCEGGNLEQYRKAMEAGTADILTFPIEKETLRLRTEKYTEK